MEIARQADANAELAKATLQDDVRIGITEGPFPIKYSEERKKTWRYD